jgi:putative transposase
VVRLLAADRFIAQDVKFLVEQEFSQDEILAHYSAGRLRFAVPEGTAEVPKPRRVRRTVQELEAHQKRILERRWRALEPLTKLGDKPLQSHYDERAAELRAKGIRCSPRTLRRYYQLWDWAGQDRLALVPRARQADVRGKPRRHSLLAKHPQVLTLVDEAIRTVYLTKARRPIATVTRRVLEDLQQLNSRLPAAQAIPVPRQAALARAIARRIKQMDPWEVDRERWGRKIADRRHAPTTSQQLATRILQRVEMDHSPLKVVVGTEAGPIGQPWLTLLIDYYSRMVVGFCLGFEPPSYAVIMEALRHAILPKTYVKERYPRTQGVWPCFGLPEKLVCDRGPDLTSKDLEDAALQLGVELDFNPPRTPNLKGTVESFFDGLVDLLTSALPGRTFRNWADRADYKPDQGPLLSYETLLEVIHLHLVDVYAAQKHPTAAKTRLEMWQESAALFPPTIPATSDDLVVLLAKRTDRTVSTRGIELGGMFYTSDELMALRCQLATHNLAADKLAVRFNPWDLGEIRGLNPIDKTYLKAAAIDTVMKGMTQYQWRVLKRAIRERFDQPDHVLSLAAARNAIREVMEEALKRPSGKRRVRVARFLQPLGEQPQEWSAVAVQAQSPAPPPGAPPSIGDGTGAEHPPAPNSEPIVSEQSPEPPNPADIDVDDWEVAA